ncbi:MAG TPA: hypothetical protein V6D28_00900 [Leptolyngbyaceae cyanobacterium]
MCTIPSAIATSKLRFADIFGATNAPQTLWAELTYIMAAYNKLYFYLFPYLVSGKCGRTRNKPFLINN